MQSTFKKTLLASLVLFGLTACGSGGGGGSSAPTTSSNTNDNITVPNVSTPDTAWAPQLTNTSTQNTTSNQNSDTAVTTPTNSQNNGPQTPIVTPSTFKITNDGYATGRATYASANSSTVLNADFDKREISGYAVGKIDDQTVNITLEKTTLYKGSAKYINGNYPSYNETYDFEGKATGISRNQENFSGKYAGFIYGKKSGALSQASVDYLLTSESDDTRKVKSAEYSRYGTLMYKKSANNYIEGANILHRQ